MGNEASMDVDASNKYFKDGLQGMKFTWLLTPPAAAERSSTISASRSGASTFRGPGNIDILNPVIEPAPVIVAQSQAYESQVVDAVNEASEFDRSIDEPMDEVTRNTSYEALEVPKIFGYNGAAPSVERILKLYAYLVKEETIVKVLFLEKASEASSQSAGRNPLTLIKDMQFLVGNPKQTTVYPSLGHSNPMELKRGNQIVPNNKGQFAKRRRRSADEILDIREFDPLAWLITAPDSCKCPVCGELHIDKIAFSRHIMSHSVLRQISCACRSCYCRIDSLKRHCDEPDANPKCKARYAEALMENAAFNKLIDELEKKVKEGCQDPIRFRLLYESTMKFRIACARPALPEDRLPNESLDEQHIVQSVLRQMALEKAAVKSESCDKGTVARKYRARKALSPYENVLVFNTK